MEDRSGTGPGQGHPDNWVEQQGSNVAGNSGGGNSYLSPGTNPLSIMAHLHEQQGHQRQLQCLNLDGNGNGHEQTPHPPTSSQSSHHHPGTGGGGPGPDFGVDILGAAMVMSELDLGRAGEESQGAVMIMDTGVAQQSPLLKSHRRITAGQRPVDFHQYQGGGDNSKYETVYTSAANKEQGIEYYTSPSRTFAPEQTLHLQTMQPQQIVKSPARQLTQSSHSAEVRISPRSVAAHWVVRGQGQQQQQSKQQFCAPRQAPLPPFAGFTGQNMRGCYIANQHEQNQSTPNDLSVVQQHQQGFSNTEVRVRFPNFSLHAYPRMNTGIGIADREQFIDPVKFQHDQSLLESSQASAAALNLYGTTVRPGMGMDQVASFSSLATLSLSSNVYFNEGTGNIRIPTPRAAPFQKYEMVRANLAQKTNSLTARAPPRAKRPLPVRTPPALNIPQMRTTSVIQQNPTHQVTNLPSQVPKPVAVVRPPVLSTAARSSETDIFNKFTQAHRMLSRPLAAPQYPPQQASQTIGNVGISMLPSFKDTFSNQNQAELQFVTNTNGHVSQPATSILNVLEESPAASSVPVKKKRAPRKPKEKQQPKDTKKDHENTDKTVPTRRKPTKEKVNQERGKRSKGKGRKVEIIQLSNLTPGGGPTQSESIPNLDEKAFKNTDTTDDPQSSATLVLPKASDHVQTIPRVEIKHGDVKPVPNIPTNTSCNQLEGAIQELSIIQDITPKRNLSLGEPTVTTQTEPATNPTQAANTVETDEKAIVAEADKSAVAVPNTDQNSIISSQHSKPLVSVGVKRRGRTSAEKGNIGNKSSSSQTSSQSKNRSNTGSDIGVKMAPTFAERKDQRKWFPSPEEQKELYADSCFVMEAEKAGRPTMEVTLYRIRNSEKAVVLQKYDPIDLSGRELHRATGTMLVIDAKDKAFFNRFHPVYCLKIIDTEKVSVFHYLNVDRITPYLLQIRETKDLFTHFRIVADLIFREIIFGGNYIKGRIQPDSPNFDLTYKTSWDRLNQNCQDRVMELCRGLGLADGFLKPFCAYPYLRFARCNTISSKLPTPGPKKIGCGACVQRSHVAVHCAMLKTETYDPITFEPEVINNPESKDELERYYLCNVCKDFVFLMWKLMHHKWYLFATIRGYVTDLVSELDPDEKLDRQQTIDTLLNDYEWLGKSFLEFQVLLAEADTEIKDFQRRKTVRVVKNRRVRRKI